MEKLHWTQRPENKEKVRAMAKRAAKTRNGQSKAETLIKRKVSVSTVAPGLERMQLYIRAVKAAVKANELSKLVAEIKEQALAGLWEGAK